MSSIIAQSDTQETEQTFQPSDFSFLSQLLHIIQKIEAGEDTQEIATLSSNLKSSFKKCQMILDHLPGADLSPDEQERILAEETQVLERKKAQLAKYLSWQVFQYESTDVPVKQDLSTDTHMLSESNNLNLMADTRKPLIKEEMSDTMPSLATDSSFLMDSSQDTLVPSSLSSGLTFQLSDVKMEDSNDHTMLQ